jgi:hypothetical protein
VKLWLDDFRPPPDETWLWVKTAPDAVKVLKTRKVEQISLDYDVLWAPGGSSVDWENKRTGMAVVLFMERKGIWPPEIRIHSKSVGGAARMAEVLERNGKKWLSDT